MSHCVTRYTFLRVQLPNGSQAVLDYNQNFSLVFLEISKFKVGFLMVLIERISYEIGGILADIVLMSILPTDGFTVLKVSQKFASFATSHSISHLGSDYLTKNLFDCLPYLK